MSNFLDQAGYILIKGIAWFLRLLPLRVAVTMGRFLGLCFFYISSRRRVAYADLKAALGVDLSEKERWRVVKEHYKNHGQMFVEVLCFPKLNTTFIDQHVEVNHVERYLNLVEQKRGVALLTAHFGNWELLQIISGILGRPVTVLARDQKHSKLDDFLNELRQTHGSVAIKRGMNVRELLRSLRRNELVGVLGDQDADRDKGLIMNFLGRKTTVPTGVFEIASRTDVPVLPCFIHRTQGVNHTIDICEPIECGDIKEGGEEVLRKKVEIYVRLLEKFIRKHPSQWLWESKRWKYSWTKRILILSDGKAGHLKQSQAVANHFKTIENQYGRPGMEYPTETIQVEFKSEWHRKLFPWFALFFIPFAQGRLRWLGSFFKRETQEKIQAASADFIISAGSSLVPLNLALAKDSRAKSIVLMKPSFPFNLFEYDLVIVPMHDQGIIPKREFRTLLTPNLMEESDKGSRLNWIQKELKRPEAVKVALFIGGSTRDFHMDYAVAEKLVTALRRVAKNYGDYIITTSRRTPDSISQYFKKAFSAEPACQMLVIAKEDTRPQVVGGMMALAEVLVVTEDSVSMISEAIGSGKKVIVIDLETNKLPKKHKRFKSLIEEKAEVVSVRPEDLDKAIQQIQGRPAPEVFMNESIAMKGQLQEIL